MKDTGHYHRCDAKGRRHHSGYFAHPGKYGLFLVSVRDGICDSPLMFTSANSIEPLLDHRGGFKPDVRLFIAPSVRCFSVPDGEPDPTAACIHPAHDAAVHQRRLVYLAQFQETMSSCSPSPSPPACSASSVDGLPSKS